MPAARLGEGRARVSNNAACLQHRASGQRVCLPDGQTIMRPSRSIICYRAVPDLPRCAL